MNKVSEHVNKFILACISASMFCIIFKRILYHWGKADYRYKLGSLLIFLILLLSLPKLNSQFKSSNLISILNLFLVALDLVLGSGGQLKHALFILLILLDFESKFYILINTFLPISINRSNYLLGTMLQWTLLIKHQSGQPPNLLEIFEMRFSFLEELDTDQLTSSG